MGNQKNRRAVETPLSPRELSAFCAQLAMLVRSGIPAAEAISIMRGDAGGGPGGELLAAIGVENDAAEFTGWEYPADQAVNLYPDIIFYDEGIDPEYFKGTQVYNTTDAYKQGRIYPVNGTALERQSGRMFAELEKMFAEAYPELASLLDAPPEEEPAAESSSGEESGGDDGMLDISDMTQVG